MSYTQLSNNTVNVHETGVPNSKSFKNKDCSTCKHEDASLKCDHPEKDTKKFEVMSMEECYEYGVSMTTAQRDRARYDNR